MTLTTPMKFAFCISLLLTGLQVHGHHVPGHLEEEEHNGDKSPPDPQQEPPSKGQGMALTRRKITDINNDFALRFYKLVVADSPAQNVLVAPLSITMAFGMLTLGAKGETHHQILNGLGFDLSDTEENEIHGVLNHIVRTLNQPSNVTQMNIGNALFIEESLPLQPKFQNDVKTLYDAEGFPVNFKNSAAAENEINDYVKNKTHGKITQAVQGLDENTLMVLLNYVFFKACWQNPFYPESTREADFFVDANTTVKVNMMYREGYYHCLYDEELSCWVVRVPYNGDYGAWFILPDQGKMKVVEDGMSRPRFGKWNSTMKYCKMKMHVPKFTISGSYDVKEKMQKLGMTAPFTENADLSGITGQHNVKLSKAYHKTVLDVHEGGTEAAAVTVIEAVFTSAQFPPPPIIRFDHPFLIVIGSRATYHFMFMGKVMNPTAK